MSGVEAVSGAIDDLPTFELDYGIDDPDEPGEVTIFAPEAEHVTTCWLSIDARHAVSIEDVA